MIGLYYGKDTYNIGANEEMRVVRNAIVRAVQVDRSVSGFVHCGRYMNDMIGIALRMIDSRIQVVESGLVSKGNLATFCN